MSRELPKTPKGLRVPKDATLEMHEAADYAFGRLIDVAAGRVNPQKAAAVLKGAVEIRKEVCGPIAQKVEVKATLEDLLGDAMKPE